MLIHLFLFLVQFLIASSTFSDSVDSIDESASSQQDAPSSHADDSLISDIFPSEADEKLFSYGDLIDLVDGITNIKAQRLEAQRLSAVIYHALRLGELKAVQYFVDENNFAPKMVDIAARNGHDRIVIFLLSKFEYNFYPRLLVQAIKSMNINLIQYIFSLISELSDKNPESNEMYKRLFWWYISMDGEQPLIKNNMRTSEVFYILYDWLIDDGRYSKDFKDFLAGVNTLSIDNNEKKPIPNNKQTAEMLSLIEILEKHQTISEDINSYIVKACAKFGDVVFLKYFCAINNITPDINTLNDAARYGQLRMVIYLIEKVGIKPNKVTLLNSIISLNQKLCQYLLYNKRMIRDKESVKLIEEIRRGGDEFLDCVSELPSPLESGANSKGINDGEKFMDCISSLPPKIKSLIKSKEMIGGEEFFDSISEQTRPTKSALKTKKDKDIKKTVSFNDDNEVFVVDRYLVPKSRQSPRPVSRESHLFNLFYSIAAMMLIRYVENSMKPDFKSLSTQNTIMHNIKNVFSKAKVEGILKEDPIVKPK